MVDVADLLAVFADGTGAAPAVEGLVEGADPRFDERFARTSPFLTHPVFSRYHSETEMLRYMRTLESKDLSLTHSMIALGSCTMKLNATSEMVPVTWREIGAPASVRAGGAGRRAIRSLFERLEASLAEITGFAAVSLQPNAGSQGEYAGLLVIRAYHESRGETHRTVCLIPQSAHGTNPASAVMAGMRGGRREDRRERQHRRRRSAREGRAAHGEASRALMVTYPSTHGVFEEGIKESARSCTQHGGQVYLDGANMNAMVGLVPPGRHRRATCAT